MIPIRTSLMIGAALAVGLVVANPSQASTSKHQAVPPASFLKYRVNSVAELLAQVRNDRTVRLRYAHLFNVSESKVVDYMTKNIVESYVPATGKYAVWCVSRNGHMFVVKQRFQSGLRVFALRNGLPVMKWACGNPLTKNLPSPPIAPPLVSKVIRTPLPQLVPSEKIADYVDTMPTETAMALVTPPEAPLPENTVHPLVVAPVELTKGSTEEIVFSSSATRIPILPFIPLVGFIPRTGGTQPFGSTGTGGSGSVSGSGSRGGSGSPQGSGTGTLVPETSPVITVMLGLLPLSGLILAARRRRQSEAPEKLAITAK